MKLATEPTRHQVLIVDDEENVRRALKRSLRKEPYELLFAANAFEALDILELHPIDVVLSDHLMPRMTGLEFLTEVGKCWPEVIRIILTGHADMETAIKAINEGEIYRFLTKPWEDHELKLTLKLAFERLELERENQRLLETVRTQGAYIRELETRHPGISHVERDESGAVVFSQEELTALGM